MSAPSKERLDARDIRSLHPSAYRAGEWARLVSVVEHKGRDCYLVRFPDGASDWWVVDDPDGRYEFRASASFADASSPEEQPGVAPEKERSGAGEAEA